MNYIPQFFPEYWKTEHNVYGINFTNEISIGFVEKLDGGYSFLSNLEFEKLKIDSKKLLIESIKNLKNLFDNCDLKIYEIDGGKMGFWNSENDNFTSVRILIPEYRKIILENISENFSFSIPSRDIITCWKTDSKKECEKFKRETKEDFKEEEYNLSEKIYNWKNVEL
ncbi:hypothetical protein [Winogradskyella immobilis]|uniref:Uncharacterized protein n=1 Tax=Winogradskyella immobilis TaxID=2816852 RepID=A0ABS8ES33_9FLAO|nr:hypothetical protein [Winogradskyella immobilis]MCC1485677.1 hypothetical protein [Winogradskyella immobilis]MCG0017771.1 hypothetical protein [Winogradskyella immobilis]